MIEKIIKFLKDTRGLLAVATLAALDTTAFILLLILLSRLVIEKLAK
jgi:hypothetical protein